MNRSEFFTPTHALAADEAAPPLLALRNFYDVLRENAREGMLFVAPDGRVIDVNQAFCGITGYSRAEVIGQHASMLRSTRQPPEFYADLAQELQAQGHWEGELWNRRKNGEEYRERLSIHAIRNEAGEIEQFLALFSDITLLRQREHELENLAHFDALTHLPNRVLLGDRLQQAMLQMPRHGQHLAVVFLDLDGFKAVNDSHGHDAGDYLLVALGARMKRTLREGDTLARLGGDEFVVVLPDLAAIEDSYPILQRLLQAVAQGVAFDGAELQVSASLGVTFYPQSEEVDADQLLRQADQAMYQAKLSGKNRYHCFDAELDRNLRGHHERLDRLRRALRDGELVLHYQPKVNMRTGEMIGAEALIRWQHPDGGLLPPAAFLPLIEHHPLSIEIGEWVLEAALSQIECWQSQGLHIPLSINIDAYQLEHPQFVTRLRAALARHPAVPPGDLQLEVLETSALADLAVVSSIIDDCQKLGVNFALDDFGTGYSSLTYLKRLPVSRLKLDQSFVCDTLGHPDDLAILRGVLGLAEVLHRQIIAEGVETLEQRETLLEMGCDLAQGYGIARPMPAEELPGWVDQWLVAGVPASVAGDSA